MADMFDKEELSIVGGLFPNTLATAEDERQSQQEAAFKRYSGGGANQNPLALLSGLSGMFSTAAGQELRGLAGVQSPTMQLVSLRNQAAKQFDTSTPEGLVQMAQFLNQQGDAAGARQAIMVAQGQAQRSATLEKTGAEITAKLREPLPNIAKLQAYRTNLVSQFGENDPRVKEVDRVIAAEGEGKGTKIINDLAGFANIYAKKEAEEGAKDVTSQISKAQEVLQTSAKVSRDIDEIERILPNTFTGQFANIAKTASKTLAAAGISISDKASNTEVLQALTNNLVLPAVKQLPGSLAAKELAFLQQTKPEALQEPATIKRLLTLLREDIGVNRALVKRADAYKKADKLGSLQGFNIALQQDSLYQDLRRFNALKAKVNANPGKKVLTQTEADFAAKLEEELGL